MPTDSQINVLFLIINSSSSALSKVRQCAFITTTVNSLSSEKPCSAQNAYIQSWRDRCDRLPLIPSSPSAARLAMPESSSLMSTSSDPQYLNATKQKIQISASLKL